MSVLNDVLKNLDEQQAQKRRQVLTEQTYEVRALPWYVWSILSSLLTIIVVLSILIFFLHNPSLNVPHDLYDLPDETITHTETIAALKETQPDEQITLSSQVKTGIKPTKYPPKKQTEAQNIISKTQQTQAEEIAIAALKNGETDQVKAILPVTQPQMQENLNLRIMLKESPEKVLPYLQSRNPDFVNNTELLALAAQAQQRASEHQSAVTYYQELIKRQPYEYRWHAGLAISLDGLGEHQKAQKLYQSVLATNSLATPLKRFIQRRLKKLENNNG